jgi:hypothetical protein
MLLPRVVSGRKAFAIGAKTTVFFSGRYLIMPLGFQSVNRGSIAFGFFNIDSDLLLLDHYFLFATEFCAYLSQAARATEEDSNGRSWGVYCFENSTEIGDLMGAIHGIHFSGFIGEVYKLFPFPEQEEDFKQKPEGDQTRPRVEALIQQYAEKRDIPFLTDGENDIISIGDYSFTKPVFHELIQYVWRGGYPRWRDEIRPAYVKAMREIITQSEQWLFKGLSLPVSPTA